MNVGVFLAILLALALVIGCMSCVVMGANDDKQTLMCLEKCKLNKNKTDLDCPNCLDYEQCQGGEKCEQNDNL